MSVCVKICGLTRVEDLVAAAEFGADALGLILEPSSPRFLASDEQIRDLVQAAPPFTPTVSVIGIYRSGAGISRFAPPVIQAVDFEGRPDPRIRRLQVRRVSDTSSADEILSHLEHRDALVLDAFDPHQYGGTGHRIDWDLAAEVVRRSPLAVILAGGLTPDNVAEAVQKVRPYAVDVASGVESAPGIKDHVKMRDFIQAAKEA